MLMTEFLFMKVLYFQIIKDSNHVASLIVFLALWSLWYIGSTVN